MSAQAAGKIIRMDGQTVCEGDERLTEAMREGVLEGLSRAEMRQRMEEAEAEAERLREMLAESRAKMEDLRARTRAAEAECRIKDAILHADRTGRLAAMERRWRWERRRTAERVANAVMPWVWILAAFALITGQIMRLTGRV